MSAKTIPRLLTLKQAAEALGGNIPVSTLRSEVKAGRLRCVRARPSCNSPILIPDEEILIWIEKYASARQVALSPREAGAANRASRGSR